MDELKEELTVMKVKASEASINMASSKEKEEAMRGRLDKAQSELDRLRLDSRNRETRLRVSGQ